MKMKLQTSAIAIAMIMILSATSLLVSGLDNEAPRSKDKSKRTVEGVWRTSITFVDCQTGVTFPIPPLSGLFTFHEGGTMSEYGNRPNQATPARGPGHGLWKREHGWQDHSFKIIFNRYNTSGEFIGTQVARGVLELGADGDSFNTSANIQVFDVDGNLVNSGCSTSVGSRFD